jgi:hypothetical protein
LQIHYWWKYIVQISWQFWWWLLSSRDWKRWRNNRLLYRLTTSFSRRLSWYCWIEFV